MLSEVNTKFCEIKRGACPDGTREVPGRYYSSCCNYDENGNILKPKNPPKRKDCYISRGYRCRYRYVKSGLYNGR